MDSTPEGVEDAGEVAPAGPPDGLDQYVPAAPAPRPVPWVPILATLVVLAGVVAGGLALAARKGGTVAGPPVSAVLRPGSPIDGKASKRHPVRVSPDTGLVDGQVVTVSGSEFPPNAEIGVVMCTNAAAVRGVDACDIGTSSYLAGQQVRTSTEGTFSLQYKVSRRFWIKDPNAPPPVATTLPAGGPTPPVTCSAPARNQVCSTVGTAIAGPPVTAPSIPVDCLNGNVDPAVWAQVVAEQGERAPATGDPDAFTCTIAAGVISDYDQSGGWPVAFEGEVFRTPSTTAPPTTEPATVTTAVTTTAPGGPVTAPGATASTTLPTAPSSAPRMPTTAALPPPSTTTPTCTELSPASLLCTPPSPPPTVATTIHQPSGGGT